MNKKNNRKGFTIVELVIVIAVIAVLATVLVPTFGNVIEKSKNSALVQQLRNEYMEYVASEADEEDYDPDATVVIMVDGGFYSFEKGEMQMSSADDSIPAPYSIQAGEKYWDGSAVAEYTAPATPSSSSSSSSSN